MKEIQLTKGRVTFVDDEDFDWLSQWKWYASSGTNGYFYAIRPARGTIVFMHRLILKPEKSQVVDHANHDSLDNRKENIRICTNQQNQFNQLPQVGKTSKYKGVSWKETHKKWYVDIKLNGKKTFIGQFDDEVEAARAYNTKAREYFGEFAYLNKVA